MDMEGPCEVWLLSDLEVMIAGSKAPEGLMRGKREMGR